MDKNVRYVKVFTPYNEWYHTSYFGYHTEKFGELPFGMVVQTSMGVAVIIDPDVPEEKLPDADIYSIYGPANKKQIKKIEKEWCSVIMEIHTRLLNYK